MPFSDAIRIGASGAADFEVERSLRFNSADTTYLNRTPSSASNRKTWTWSSWVKREQASGGTDRFLFIAGMANGSDNIAHLSFDSNDRLRLYAITGSFDYKMRTNSVYRDFSAWYHVVVAFDTTQATASNRIKFYVNGVQVTDLGQSDYPSQNHDSYFNNTDLHNIGRYNGGSTQWYQGYMAEINFIDGFAYDPSYFGETNPATGQWNPKKYTGSYGTNGFYLNFSDNSGTTATTLGKDSSGNGNNWTPNNFTTGDAVKDSPTNNFCTLRKYGTPSSSGSGLGEGSLEFSTGSSGNGDYGNRLCFNTIAPTSGKWYAEVCCNTTNYIFVGVHPYQVETAPTSSRTRWQGLYSYNGDNYLASTSSSASSSTYAASYGTNDIIGIYMDMDASPPQVYYSKNGQWANGSGAWNQSSPSGAISLGGSFFTEKTGGFTGLGINIQSSSSAAGVTARANFGQDSTFAGITSAGGNTDANGIGDFKYTVPTNALALCTANLSDPTIKLPNKHFEARTYTGTATGSGTQTLTGFQFQPDWVWIKSRGIGYSHLLVDAVRGASKGLLSEDTNAEETTNVYGMLTAFTSDGYTMTRGSNDGGKCCENTQPYVSWNWNAGDTDSATYTVKVVSDSGNKYRFNNFGTSAVTLDLAEGGTYTFDQSDSSMSSHPMKLSTTANGTHGGGSSYNTGVTYQLDGSSVTESAFVSGFSSASSRKLIITVAASAPTLYYYCHYHSGMGGQANTNSTLGSSNFDGSIQTTAKVNASAGFSIVTYTGNNASATIGHGLGVAPNVVIIKRRNGTGDWIIGHDGLASNAFANNKFLKFTASSTFTNSLVFGSQPTSSVVQIVTGSGATNLNGSSDTYVAYCFSEVAGYSKFGSYTGNQNADGTFVFLGFRPAWVLVKGNWGGNWNLFDNKRPGINVTNDRLFPNLADAETDGSPTDNQMDLLSNGFKLRGNNNDTNHAAGFIYLAFAESPFKNSRAR